MNKVIKALFIQAGGTVEEENGNLWTYSDDLDPELFAELIVRECAEVVYSRSGHATPQDLYEHFGVKE